MSAIDECKQEKNSVLNTHNETRGFQVERGRAVDSPLGQLDPSRITHMVVDQAGLGASAEHCSSSGFIAGPPQQHWTCSSPAAAPIMSTLSRVMDGCGQMQPRMGTPTNAMHMQQGTISSPSIGSAPMTPQHMVQHQQQAMVQGQQTPTGQFDQTGRFAQHQQGYLQGVPESPGSVQQQKVMNGSGGQPDNSSGMVHTRQQMMIGQQQQIINLQQQQQMMSQQQPIIGQQMMVPQQMTMMDASSQQYYAQQNPQAQWTQQQQMQQTQFVRQPQMIGPQVGQRVMVQRVLYPSGPGFPTGMQAAPQQQQGVVTQPSSRPSGAPPPQQAQRPTYPLGSASQPTQYTYSIGQTAGFQQQQAAQTAVYQQQMYQRQQQV